MLKEKVKSGFLWSTGLNLFRDVLQFGMMLVLVRILPPTAYGQFGFVTTLVGFFAVFSFRSFLEHTLQLRPQDEVDYQTHFTLACIIQVLAFAGINAVAFGLRFFPDYAGVAPLVHVMSILFILDLMSEFRVKRLERALDWKRLRMLQAAGMLLNAIAAVALALCGAGVYALLIPGLLLTLPFIYDLAFVERWRPSWRLDIRGFRPAWRYGLARIGSGVVVTGRQLIESGALVHLVGFSAFGLYGRAVGLSAICCLKLSSSLTLMLFPILTKIEPRSDAYGRASALVLQSVAWVTIPAAALFSMIAEPTIRILYGPKWIGAAPLLPWALAAAAVTALTQTASILLLANLEQKRCLVSDLMLLVGTTGSLVFLAPQGLSRYLIGVTGTQLVSLIFMLYWLHSGRALASQAIWNALALPVCAATSMVLAAKFIVTWSGPVQSGFLAAGYAIAFALAYLAVLRFASAKSMAELVSYCPGGYYLKRLLVLEA